MLPGVVVFVFTKFQHHLSTVTSCDLTSVSCYYTVRSDDVKVLKSRWNFVKTLKTTTPGNNIYTLFITFIVFTSFISSKFQTLFFPYKLSYYATGGPYYGWATCDHFWASCLIGPDKPVRNLQRCTAPQNCFKIAVQLNYSCLAAF